MLLRTRFIIVITTFVVGILTILCLTVFLMIGINRLNRVDTICNRSVNTLKQLQLSTSQLLTTQELDNTFAKWQRVYQDFRQELTRLNTSPEIHDFLSSSESQGIIKSMNIFWTFTEKKTDQVERDLAGLLGQPNQSRDGLIYQYADSNDHGLLVIRNTIYSTLLFLEAEFETKLTKLITIVEQEKNKRFYHLIFQISAIGLVVALIVATILISFLTRLRFHLNKLYQAMDVIGKGDFTKKLYISGNDELSQIADAINKTTDALSDIHQELEQRLQEISLAKEKAEAANMTKSIFLANMSHEIRTPLNAVIGFSDLLANLAQDKYQKSYLSAIQTAGRSLLTLINDILDLSKIEAEKLNIQYAPCNLRAIFHDVEQVFENQASKKNIGFYHEINGFVPQAILLDKTRLRQILFNIVGNAFKFTEKGHIRLSLDIQKHGEKPLYDLHFSVEDTGIGIPEGEICRIFESFEQQSGQDPSVYGGTGLGLTISRHLVEMMNGRIWVDSHVNKGSTFHVLIPGVRPTSDERAVIEESFNPDLFPFEKKLVLVVDDVESHRNLLSSLLSQVNLDVRTAENGQDALEKALECKPDIILMDIRMPVMDGVSAIRRLKAQPKTAHIPVIAVTASSAHRDTRDLLKTGFDCSFPKPIEIGRLLSELTRYLPLRSTHSASSFLDDTIERTRLGNILPGLIKDLESHVLDHWNKFRERQPMDEVKAFAERVKALGKTHAIDILSVYGDNLITHVDNFDVSNMQTAIKDFPSIIQDIKSLGGGHNAS